MKYTLGFEEISPNGYLWELAINYNKKDDSLESFLIIL